MAKDTKIVVLPKSKAKEFSSEVPWVCISIVTPGDSWPKIGKVKCLDILQIAFADVEEPTKEFPIETLINKNKATKIIDFVDRWWGAVEILMIHCEAGLIRSPAVAAAISQLKLGFSKDYFDRYTPSNLIYQTLLGVANG